jgi:hypothetical protein
MTMMMYFVKIIRDKPSSNKMTVVVNSGMCRQWQSCQGREHPGVVSTASLTHRRESIPRHLATVPAAQ